MRFAFKTFLAVAVVSLCLPAHAELIDAIWAVVGEAIVTMQQVQSLVIPQEDTLRMQAKNSPTQYAKLRGNLEADVLRNMIDEKMILHEFGSSGFKIPESIIDDFVQDKIRDRFHDDRVEMMKRLEHNGISYEDFKQQLHDQFIVEVMEQKFVPDPIISPLKMETYYREHQAEFKQEDQIKMRLIVLNKQPEDTNGTVRRRMGEIQTQVKDGAAFSDLAKSYSEGSQRTEGGETGWQEVSTLNKALVEGMKNLKPGEYSGVIEGTDAYFLVLLEERQPARVKPLTEVQGEIEKLLTVQERNRLVTRWIARLRRKTFVREY